jgi:hypothetical protein
LEKLLRVRHVVASLLLSNFLLIGSGALEYIHNWAHELEDEVNDRAQAQLLPIAAADKPPAPARHEHHHDENNCEVHAQLHMAIIAHSWTPLLIWLGVWVAFLSLLAVPLVPRQLPIRIDCRGPPGALAAISF